MRREDYGSYYYNYFIAIIMENLGRGKRALHLLLNTLKGVRRIQNNTALTVEFRSRALVLFADMILAVDGIVLIYLTSLYYL